jgi:hypothetical protein
MSDCLDADATLAIGDALEWRISEGLSHLATCGECRARLELMQRIRRSVLASTPVDTAIVEEVCAALRQAKRDDLSRGQPHARIRQGVEACTAGVAGLIAVTANGVSVDDPAVAVVAFTLGAILMTAGSAIARRLLTAHVRRAHA